MGGKTLLALSGSEIDFPPAIAARLSMTATDWLPACLKDLVDLAPDGSSGRHRTAGTWLRLFEISALDISASGIRARIQGGQSIRYLVPDSVREAVAESRCYERRARPGSQEDA